MRLTACLCWYDEPDEWLDRCVRSLAGLADRVVAYDGRLELYPGTEAASPPSNRATIHRAAAAVGIKSVVFVPDTTWASESHKRTAMIQRACEGGADFADWLLMIDGDEEAVHDQDARELLAASPYDELQIWRQCVPNPDVSPADIDHHTDVRDTWLGFLMRQRPNLRVQYPSHYDFRGVDRHGVDRQILPDQKQRVVSLNHWTLWRSRERFTRKDAYIQARARARQI